jgi:bloom syndrome protein
VLRKEFPKVPILALTSSATNRCKVDTMRQLGLEECDFFTQSFNRPNLRFALSLSCAACGVRRVVVVCARVRECVYVRALQ